MRDPQKQHDHDIILAHQYWMGPGYPTVDLFIHRNSLAESDAIPVACPWHFPLHGCNDGMLSEKTLREFFALVERLHVCDEPPQPTWENVGIDALCLRKGNDICMLGIGNDEDPRERVLKMAVGQLAIKACTSQIHPPSKTTM